MKILPGILLSILIITSTWAMNSSEMPRVHDWVAIDTLIERSDLKSTEQTPPAHSTNKHDSFHQTAKILEIAVPSLMVAYGASSFFLDGIRQVDYNIDQKIHNHGYIWNSKADDYLQFVPATAAFILKLAKIESKNNLLGMAIIYALSGGLTFGVVETTKVLTDRERPDGSANNSFPSGHTATAFAAAEFLHQEFGYHSIWISIGGYTVATMVGASRIFNDKHWLSDVVAGAGIGILSTKAIYWLYPYLQKKLYKKNKKWQIAVLQDSIAGGWSLRFSCIF